MCEFLSSSSVATLTVQPNLALDSKLLCPRPSVYCDTYCFFYLDKENSFKVVSVKFEQLESLKCCVIL